MKNGILFFIFTVLMSVGSIYAQTPPSTLWSDSTSTNWYNTLDTTFTISNAKDFAGLSKLVAEGNNFSGKTIFIGADINLGDNLWTPIGKNVNFPFSGTFDGGEFSISNLYIVTIDGDFTGLFGRCTGAFLKNINLKKVYIRTGDTAGSLAGSFGVNGNIENCHATEIDIEATKYNIGGLVGELIDNSNMFRCSAEGKVIGNNQVGGLLGTPYNLTKVSECYSKGTVSAQFLAGGLIGYSTFAFMPDKDNTIINCYSRANVTVNNGRSGGLVGGTEADLIIQNSYSTGTSVGTAVDADYIGGFIGAIDSVSTTNNYWDKETSAHSYSAGGFTNNSQTLDITAKTSSEMKTIAMVNLLNQNQINGPWGINPAINDGYPILDTAKISVGISNVADIEIAIFPTVFEDYILVKTSENLLTYQLINISGSIISEARFNANEIKIDTKSIVSGVYFLVVNTGKGEVVKKVIKR